MKQQNYFKDLYILTHEIRIASKQTKLNNNYYNSWKLISNKYPIFHIKLLNYQTLLEKYLLNGFSQIPSMQVLWFRNIIGREKRGKSVHLSGIKYPNTFKVFKLLISDSSKNSFAECLLYALISTQFLKHYYINQVIKRSIFWDPFLIYMSKFLQRKRNKIKTCIYMYVYTYMLI